MDPILIMLFRCIVAFALFSAGWGLGVAQATKKTSTMVSDSLIEAARRVYQARGMAAEWSAFLRDWAKEVKKID